MKLASIIVVLCVACLPFGVAAQTSQPAAPSTGETAQTSNADVLLKLCKSHSILAKTIMSARQSGVAMSKMIDVADKRPDTKALLEAMIIEAYKQPRYFSEQMKQRTISDFRDKMYLECIESLKSRKHQPSPSS